MTDIFRTMCVELVELSAPTNSIPQLTERLQKLAELANRARAALAQPAPAPTDEDLEDLAEVMNVSGNPVPAMRRALELWGNSQGILDSSPQAEPVAPTDEELIELIVWMIDEHVYDTDKGEIAESLRELIARWGTPANNTREENLEVSNG
jgi:hypothetical protein